MYSYIYTPYSFQNADRAPAPGLDRISRYCGALLLAVIVALPCEQVAAQTDGDVRIVGTETSRGRIEVYGLGQWRGVCDDFFDRNNNAATVVCRQLGYKQGTPLTQLPGSNVDFLLDDVFCGGAEASLLECSNTGLGLHDCGPNEHAGVVCTNPVQAATAEDRPQNLRALVVNGGVELRWDPPTSDAASVTGYEILRRRPKENEKEFTTLVDNTGDTDTTYVDTTAREPGVRYTYRVKAIRGTQRSEWSRYATVLVLPSRPPPLVSNLGQSPTAAATVTDDYTLGFRLGGHGQGYAIDSISIDLAAVPQSLTASVWIAGIDGMVSAGERRYKLFDFTGPGTLQVGLNKFTAPPGSWVYQNVNHYIVLSDFGASLSVNETTSNAEDAGAEQGAHLDDDASSSGSGVLRLSLEGSRRDRGILAANFARARIGAPDGQEIISLGDDCCFGVGLRGTADRYLVRSLSLYGDDSTPQNGFFDLPFNVQSNSTTHFTMDMPSRSLHQNSGMNLFTAPQGATLEGDKGYVLDMDIVNDPGSNSLRGGVILGRAFGYSSKDYDAPRGGVVTFGDHGDIALPNPVLAIEGEPLQAMVSNLGQTDASYRTADSTTPFVTQGFTTGSDGSGYLLQGIDVNIEGSDEMIGMNSVAQIPAGPSAVSVAVHADVGGKPGAKLFDLVSPDAYKAGSVHYFEAPLDTWLAPSTSYVMVWRHVSGSDHRLRRTASNDEDSGGLVGFSIANAFYSGADLANLSIASGGHSLEIAAYGRAISDVPPNQMVANLAQADASAYIEAGTSSLKVVSQGFRTGSHSTGYAFQGIGVNIEGSDDSGGDAQVPDGASSVSVAVHADDNGKPGAKRFDLVSPTDFSAGSESFFAAPAGAQLAANTAYVVVWSHEGGTNHRLQPTAKNGEDPSAFGGFSIADALHQGANVNSLSANTDGYALEIAVYGDYIVFPGADGSFQVSKDWFHLPEGVSVGDQFRVVFTNASAVATSGDIEHYNAAVQKVAAQQYNDRIVWSLAREFKAVACTATVSARENTGMTDAGVPVHWLDGGEDDIATLIAETNDRFYSGDWENHDHGAYSVGNAMNFGSPGGSATSRIWTGCDARGNIHPDAHLGSTHMDGVAVGTPAHTDPAKYAPLGAVDVSKGYLSFPRDRRLRMYAISPVLTVVE